jgi:hypothetical protein
MSLLLKTGAGLLTGMIGGGLAFAFWPHVEPSLISAKSAVEKPVFVAAVAPPHPAAVIPAIVATPTAAPVDKVVLDKLAAALQTNGAARTVADITAKPTAPNEDAAKLCAQGLLALADGDIAGSRAFLERAADAGDPRALMVLGDTYDPATLTRMGAVGMRGDAARAHDYYARALAAGMGAAKQRIAALQAQGN